MTSEQIQQYRDTLTALKVPDDKLSPTRPYLHGWNDGIDISLKRLDLILKPEETKNDA